MYSVNFTTAFASNTVITYETMIPASAKIAKIPFMIFLFIELKLPYFLVIKKPRLKSGLIL